MLATQGFWAVLATGTPPTVDKVNAWLEASGHGRRDRTLINEVVKKCWVTVGERTQQTSELPGIPKDAVDLFLRLREDLMTICRAEFEDERAHVVAEADRATEAARLLRTDAERSVQAADTARNAALTRCEELNAALSRASAELKDLRERIGEERALRSKVDFELANLKATCATEVKRLEEHRDSLTDEVRRVSLQVDVERQSLKASQAECADLRALLSAARDRESKKDIELVELEARCAAQARQVESESARATRAETRCAELDTALATAGADLFAERTETERLRAIVTELSDRPDVSVAQIESALALAWASAAAAPGKVERGADGATVFAERGARYAAKAAKTLFKHQQRAK
ncbi:hypothetical protein A9762_12260 [Pandoraea sp. ISTKB]|nr:hypothetical protein A9762_12260 [Pandoraea sp. ISTKB]